MAALRRFVIALAVLAVFAGLASAQASIPMSCNVTGTNANVRLDSKVEKVGDILILCTGGSVVPDGSAITRLTFTITLSTGVTSRVLTTTGTVSEALLLIDEPGSGGSLAPGFGPDQAPAPCVTNAAGCTGSAFKESSPLGYPVMSDTQVAGGHITAGATPTNVFQGVVGTNALTFNGVPVLAPVSNGVARLYRISNIKVDGSSLTAGGTVTASVAVSGTGASGLITVPSTTVTLGTAAAGLDGTGTAITLSSSAPVCVADGTATVPNLIATVAFKEGFANSFRTRQVANNTVANALTNSLSLQNLPNADYSGSESGVVITGLQNGGGVSGTESGTTGTSGLADFGTRLKATFANLPTGAHVFVSTTNIVNGAAATVTGNGIGNSSTSSYAELIAVSSNASLEGAVDGASGPTPVAFSANSSTGIPLAEITNTATAVWEVTNGNKGSIETLSFNIYVYFAAGVPSPTTAPTVTLGFAPTTGTGITVDPRFVGGSVTGTVFSLTSCRTILLFPFLTSTTFETGIAIANTTKDPFTTTNQSGACHMNFYGTNAPTNPINTASIAAGGSYANTVGGLGATGFQGYMIAICDFQFAHGFAFISQAGSPYTGNMGYLPLVIPDPGSGARSAAYPQASGGNAGEQLGN